MVACRLYVYRAYVKYDVCCSDLARFSVYILQYASFAHDVHESSSFFMIPSILLCCCGICAQGKQRGVVRSFDFEAARFERAQARHRTSASNANRTTTARFKHLITEVSKQHPNDMKFTTIIGVAATLLGVAFTSSAEAEKIGAEIAALRGKVSGKMVSVPFVPYLFLDILTPVCFQS